MDLRSLLDMPELGMRLLSGQRHLSRRIRWVVTTDLPDPRRYLSGGELILTGMLWRHDNDAESFVHSLASAGVAGLGAGDPTMDSIPSDLVSACRRHDLPLFEVNSDVSFSTITEHVVQRVSAARSGDLAAVLGRHRHLIGPGNGLTEMLDLMHTELGLYCQIVSATGRPICRPGTTHPAALPDDEHTQLAAKAHTTDRLPARIRTGPDREYSVFGTGHQRTGWFLVTDDDHTQWPPERRAAVDELAALTGLERERELARPQTDTDLITALTTDPAPGTLDALVRHAGLPDTAELGIVVVTADGTDAHRFAAASTTELVVPWAGQIAWAASEPGTVIAVVADAERLGDHARRAAEALDTTEHRVAVGLSAPTLDRDALPGALAQARHAQRIAAARPGRAEIAGHDALTSHVLLLSVVPSELRHSYRERVLGPLLEYDREHHSALMSTMEKFLDCEGSWARCAAELHLHVNTLRYRIDRIEQLTGRDLRRLTDRVDLFLALRI